MLDPHKDEPGGTGLGLDRSQSISLEAPTRYTMLLANSGSPRLADESVERKMQAEQAYVEPASTPYPHEAGGMGAPGMTSTGTNAGRTDKIETASQSARRMMITEEDVASAQSSANAAFSSTAGAATPIITGTRFEVSSSAASGGSGGLFTNNEDDGEMGTHTRTSNTVLLNAGRGKRPHGSPSDGAERGSDGQGGDPSGAAATGRRVEPAGGRGQYDAVSQRNADVFLRGGGGEAAQSQGTARRVACGGASALQAAARTAGTPRPASCFTPAQGAAPREGARVDGGGRVLPGESYEGAPEYGRSGAGTRQPEERRLQREEWRRLVAPAIQRVAAAAGALAQRQGVDVDRFVNAVELSLEGGWLHDIDPAAFEGIAHGALISLRDATGQEAGLTADDLEEEWWRAMGEQLTKARDEGALRSAAPSSQGWTREADAYERSRREAREQAAHRLQQAVEARMAAAPSILRAALERAVDAVSQVGLDPLQIIELVQQAYESPDLQELPPSQLPTVLGLAAERMQRTLVRTRAPPEEIDLQAEWVQAVETQYSAAVANRRNSDLAAVPVLPEGRPRAHDSGRRGLASGAGSGLADTEYRSEYQLGGGSGGRGEAVATERGGAFPAVFRPRFNTPGQRTPQGEVVERRLGFATRDMRLEEPGALAPLHQQGQATQAELGTRRSEALFDVAAQAGPQDEQRLVDAGLAMIERLQERFTQVPGVTQEAAMALVSSLLRSGASQPAAPQPAHALTQRARSAPTSPTRLEGDVQQHDEGSVLQGAGGLLQLGDSLSTHYDDARRGYGGQGGGAGGVREAAGDSQMRDVQNVRQSADRDSRERADGGQGVGRDVGEFSNRGGVSSANAGLSRGGSDGAYCSRSGGSRQDACASRSPSDGGFGAGGEHAAYDSVAASRCSGSNLAGAASTRGPRRDGGDGGYSGGGSHGGGSYGGGGGDCSGGGGYSGGGDSGGRSGGSPQPARVGSRTHVISKTQVAIITGKGTCTIYRPVWYTGDMREGLSCSTMRNPRPFVESVRMCPQSGYSLKQLVETAATARMMRDLLPSRSYDSGSYSVARGPWLEECLQLYVGLQLDALPAEFEVAAAATVRRRMVEALSSHELFKGRKGKLRALLTEPAVHQAIWSAITLADEMYVLPPQFAATGATALFEHRTWEFGEPAYRYLSDLIDMGDMENKSSDDIWRRFTYGVVSRSRDSLVLNIDVVAGVSDRFVNQVMDINNLRNVVTQLQFDSQGKQPLQSKANKRMALVAEGMDRLAVDDNDDMVEDDGSGHVYFTNGGSGGYASGQNQRVDGPVVSGHADLAKWAACGLCTEEDAKNLTNPDREDGLYGIHCPGCGGVNANGQPYFKREYTHDEYKREYGKPPWGKAGTAVRKPDRDEVILHPKTLCFRWWLRAHNEVRRRGLDADVLKPVQKHQHQAAFQKELDARKRQ